MNSYAILWIVFLIFILGCHGYIYYTLTGNVLEGFREGQVGLGGPDASPPAAAGPAPAAAGPGPALDGKGEPVYGQPNPDAPKGGPQGGGGGPKGGEDPKEEKHAAEAAVPGDSGGGDGEKVQCNDRGECRKKYMEAYKATGCVAYVEPAVLDKKKEKEEDSGIWKDMMNRCQKALQPNIEEGGELSKEQLLDSQNKCCGAAGCKPKSCVLQKEWTYRCAKDEDPLFCPLAPGQIPVPAPAPVVAKVEDNSEVPAPDPQPRQTPIIPETIPVTPKEEDADGDLAAPPIQIPGHTHGEYDKEQSNILEDIRSVMAKMKEKMKESNNKKNKAKLTPDQYLLWKKAVGAIRVPTKAKKKPQPISVNVDVKDSRELHYQMPPQMGEGGGNQIDQLKDILGKMNLSEAAKKEIGKELGNVKIEGGPAKADKEVDGIEKKGESWSAKQANKSHSAKFAKLLKNAKQSKYVAYNEDNYGDLKKGQKEKESALEKGL